MTTPDAGSVTTSEVSAGLGKSPETLHRRIAESKLRACKVAGDGCEKQYVEVDNASVTSKSKIQDVIAENAEITLLQSRLTAKDTQITDFGKRLREANVITPHGQ